MSKSRTPSMPLFVDDYEAATAHLTLEEDGVYNRLLRLIWRQSTCSIPNDPDWIARRMRVDMATFDRVVAPIIDEFFTRTSGGRITQKRLSEERKFIDEKSEKNRGSAVSRWKKEKRHDANAMQPECERNAPNPIPIPIEREVSPSPTVPPRIDRESPSPTPRSASNDFDALVVDSVGALKAEFEKVWAAYPRKVGKKPAQDQWVRLRRRYEYETIAAPLRAFIIAARKGDVSKMIHLRTWLAQERFRDEDVEAGVNGIEETYAAQAARKARADMPTDDDLFRAVATLKESHDEDDVRGAHAPDRGVAKPHLRLLGPAEAARA